MRWGLAIVRSPAWIASLVCVAVAGVSAQPPADAGSVAEALVGEALEPLTAPDPCTPPFRSACPTPPGAPECRVRAHAASRDGRVQAEIVEDGWSNDLQAIHLVIRVGTDAFVRREIGHSGVGCDTFDLYATRYEVLELRVRDVLGDRAPEVYVRSQYSSGQGVHLCGTGGVAPRCVSTVVPDDARVRFLRPDVLAIGAGRLRVAL